MAHHEGASGAALPRHVLHQDRMLGKMTLGCAVVLESDQGSSVHHGQQYSMYQEWNPVSKSHIGAPIVPNRSLELHLQSR